MSKIKNIVTISLTVFILAVVIILAMAVFNQQNNNIDTSASNSVTKNADIDDNAITLSKVASHSIASDCWVIIGNKVYNVTSYIPMHPGEPGSITPFCGKDGTRAFETRGGKGSHPQKAQSMLNNYYVGSIIGQ